MNGSARPDNGGVAMTDEKPYATLDPTKQLTRQRRLLAASEALLRQRSGATERRAADRIADTSTPAQPAD
jgi:hypothetical protein